MDTGNITNSASLASVGAPKKPSQIEMAVQGLQASVQRLNVILGRLEDKLNPVLRGKMPQVEGAEKDVEQKVGLAQTIHAQVQNLNALANEADRMIERIEL